MAQTLTLDQLTVVINAQTENFKREVAAINNQLDNVGKAAEKNSGAMAKLGAAFKTVAKVGMAAVAAGGAIVATSLVKASKASWGQVDAVQQASATLGRYYDSAEDVAKVQQQLIEYAQSDMGVLFNRKDLFAAAGNLAMYGSSAEDVSKQVQILSRGMASNVLSWDEMNAVVGRVISSGKLSRTEFEMLAKAGYNLDSSLANTSVTADEFFDILDNSIPKDISQDMDNITPVGVRLQSAFRGIGNAILGVNKTQDGFLPNSLGRRIIDTQKFLTNLFNNSTIKSGIATLGQSISDAIGMIVSFGKQAWDVGVQIASYLQPAVMGLYGAIRGSLIPAFASLAERLQPFATLIGTVIVVAFNILLIALTDIINIVSGVINVITANEVVFNILLAAVVAVTAGLVAFKAAVVIASAAAAAKAAIVATLGGTISITTLATKAATVAVLALNAAWIANPIALVIAAVVGLTAAAVILTSQTRSLTEEEKYQNRIREESERISRRVKDAEEALKNSRRESERADIALERAEIALKRAVEQYGAESLEAREAQLNLEEARERADAAKGKHIAANKEQTAALDEQRRMLDEINRRLDGMNGKTVRYTIQGTEMVAKKYGGHGVVHAPTFSQGGFTGRGGKYEEAGIVHKGEFVLPKELVDQATGMPKIFNGLQVPKMPSANSSATRMQLLNADSKPTHLTVNLGNRVLFDDVVDFINNQSFMRNSSVINI